ncbi:hypothetical protein [Leptospira dzoumogneensis]|uniref:Uncharacterized protein n=1 Tax=Leptospira dzoumogneensis TaxID=2484904 RepID=A0A4Z1AK55_9LEPT|nr:hypothetical protein [Leptospira dzoumogneensis]TGM99455.1 hypothetical protein EHR06_09975 [Leptospira dzoumogneensis]
MKQFKYFITLFFFLNFINCPGDKNGDNFSDALTFGIIQANDTIPLHCGTYPNTTVNYVTRDEQTVNFFSGQGINTGPSTQFVAALFVLSHVKVGNKLILKSNTTDLTQIIRDNLDFGTQDGCPPQFYDTTHQITITTYTANTIEFVVHVPGNYSIDVLSSPVGTFDAAPTDVTMQLQ